MLGYKVEGKDTVFQIKLKEVYVFNRPKNYKKNKNYREFYKLVYNFKKVYPYALVAKEKIRAADSIMLANNFNKREREIYVKKFEKSLFLEFEDSARNMTINQGKLLLKLIDREVGQSSYYLIKNYKGGINAVFWQGIAKIFGSDLKSSYDKFGKDMIIEELVQMYQNGSFEYLYYSMFTR